MTDRKPPASPTATRSWFSSLPRGLRLGLEWLLALIVIGYFGLGAVVLATRYIILPRVSDYRPQIEAAATRAIGLPVTIGRVDAVWRGWHPYLTLEDVRIMRATPSATPKASTVARVVAAVKPTRQTVPSGASGVSGASVTSSASSAPAASTPAASDNPPVVRYGPPGAPPPVEPGLTLHRLDAVLSWTSLIHFDLRLSSLTLYEPDLTVERLADGTILAAGMPVTGNGNTTDATGIDWLMRQARVVVRNGTVRWRDASRDVPEVVVSKVNAMLRNRGFEHRFGMQASPPQGIVAPLDIRARFTNPLFARPGEIKRWRGQIYADVGTLDVAELARYVDLPGKDSRGHVAARAWVDFDSGALTGATLRAAGENTSVQLADDLPPLTFDATQGRIDLTRAGAQPDAGWNLRARDLTLQAAGRPTLDVPDLRGTYAPGNETTGLHVALAGPRFDIGAAMALVPSLPIDSQTRDTLASFRPRGRLTNFDVNYQAPKPHGPGNWRDLPGIKQLPPERDRYRVVADFEALGVDSAPSQHPPTTPGSPNAGRPGFANLSGHIDADQSRGSLTLDAKNTTLDFPGRFDQPRIDLDVMSARTSWRVSHAATKPDAPANVQVRVDALHLQNPELTGDVSGTWHNGGKGNGIVDLKGSIVRANANAVPRYLPTDIGASVRDYLQRALLAGTVQNAPFTVQGDLEDFPYGKGGGKFRLDIPLVDVTFNPSPLRPGHTEVWPAFEKVRGNLRFDADKLHIAIDSGSVFGVTLTQVVGDINEIGQDSSVLTLKGDARGPATDFVKYLNGSPVGHWIGDFTEDTRANGTTQLAMQLSMPLEHTDRSKVTGRARFLRNDVTLLSGLPTFGAVEGELAFTEHGISLDNLRGTFLGGDVRASGGSRDDGTIALNINGTMSAQGLRENRENATLAQLAKRMTGSTPYTAAVTVRQGMTDVAVQSTLAGLAVNLPAPLGKSAETALPARFTLRPQANPGGRRLDTLDFAIGSVQGNYVQQHAAGNSGHVDVLRGGIGINQPVPAPREGVQVAAQFDMLDVDAWRSVIASLGSDAVTPGTQGSPPAPAATAAAARDEFGALTPYLPTRLALHAKQVRLMSRLWPELVVGAQRNDRDWQVSLASDLVSGFAQWHAPDAKNPSGTVRARLAKLVIPREEHGSDVLTQVLDEPSDEFPAIDVVANDFVLRDKPLGRLQLNAHNDLEDGVPVWQLTKLELSNSAATLDVKGNWRTSRRRAAAAAATGSNDDVPRRTVLDFNLEVKDAGGLLDRLGLPKTLKDGAGTVSGRFGWRGGPDAIDYPTLGGKVAIDLKRGQILKADPGLAKLLGILSVQTLAKILTFDFNSVIGSGLPFDSIEGNATMQAGVANTDDLTINSSAATIKIDGHTDLAHETQDLNVLVLPKINAASASLAWAIINPALGIGTFFAQLALGDQLSRTLSTTYHVTGSWDNPVIGQGSGNKSKINASPVDRPEAQNSVPPVGMRGN
ncbi:YhdP family phospholipid transporter [Pandoraea fibrosis]|uniref:TIGR02099 family protein n=1 Tax=Pandoraea fibrosis TaxID=1891094 RepID=A0A5E4UC48_9BURK|nr:AsmA-like C-terminal region-containing protein [Pandoraea fibrosis]VVD97243.1 TIGR02099 family protein [Pandoraea fibrosis]